MDEKLTEKGFYEIFDKVVGEDRAKEKVYVVFEDVDGNYRGACYKFGKFIAVRDVGPETVLQRLITHDGQ